MTRVVQASVVVPVKDDAAHLRECLAALLRQSAVPSEIVVADNGSADHPEAVVDAARAVVERDRGAGAAPDLRMVHEPRPGVAVAVPAGYDAVGYPIILRCDADSVPSEDWVERMTARLADDAVDGRGRRIVAVTGMADFRGGMTPLSRPLCRVYLEAYQLVGGLALGHPPLWGSNLAMRRDWWQRVRGEVHRQDGVHDDYDLSFRLTPDQSFAVDRGSLVGVSWRAVVSPHRILKQLKMAVTTIRVNWGTQHPWDRWSGRHGSSAAPTVGKNRDDS